MTDPEPTLELLSRLLGKSVAKRVYRGSLSDLFLDDITVSRRHAEIIREGDAYRVRDAGSLNGTYVNRERVEEAPLTHGDVLQVGNRMTVDNGLITPTFKVKRNRIEDLFATNYDAWVGMRKPVIWHAR